MAITPVQPNPGLAQFQSDTIGSLVELWAGDTPSPVTIAATYSTAQGTAGIPANTPVSVNFENGQIALVDGTTVTKANAVTTHVVLAGSAAGHVGVYKAGCFNINALQWPAQLDTEAERLAAFDLASCQIYVKKPYYS